MNARVMLSLTLALGLATPARAGEEPARPKEMPPFGANKPLPVPVIDRSTTPEGMTLWVINRPNFPRATVLLMVKGGEAADPKGLVGLTDVLTSTLKEGTRSRNARQIADELQSVGAELDIDAGRDATYLAASGLAEGAGKMIDLVADLVQHASFPDAEVKLAKANLINDITMQEGQARFVGQRAFAKAIFGDHPYSVVTAAPEVVEKVTAPMLREALARRFRPERTLLVVAGDVTPARVKQLVASAFKGWKSVGAADVLPTAPSSSPSTARRIVLIDRPGSVQSHIIIGRTAPLRTDRDFYPLELADTILGGLFSSRLMTNIREDKGYTYTPRSQLEEHLEAGLLLVTADVRTEVTAPALMETFYELDRMWATPPTDKELERAKHHLTGIFALRNQIQSALAFTLANNWVLGVPPDEIARYVGHLETVTTGQLQKATERAFPSLTQTVVIVGDKARIAAPLARLGAVSELKP